VTTIGAAGTVGITGIDGGLVTTIGALEPLALLESMAAW